MSAFVHRQAKQGSYQIAAPGISAKSMEIGKVECLTCHTLATGVPHRWVNVATCGGILRGEQDRHHVKRINKQPVIFMSCIDSYPPALTGASGKAATTAI